VFHAPILTLKAVALWKHVPLNKSNPFLKTLIETTLIETTQLTRMGNGCVRSPALPCFERSRPQFDGFV
jgi:hypothetical protein